MGDRYGRVIFLREYAAYIKGSMVAELCELNRNMMLSVDIIPVPTDEAVREVENRLLGVETNITNWQRKQNQNNNFSAVVPYDLEQQRKESKEFLDDLTTRDQRMMFAVLTMVYTADSKEQLDSDTEALLTTARKHLCQFAVLKYQQMDGLNTVLPFGVRKIDALRTLTTESLAVFIPFRVQEIYHENGVYYGQNVISKNMIIANRRHLLNGNSFILGVSGAGKSFTAKEEMTNIILTDPNADIIIIDPEREYSPLVKAMQGEVIHISATSENHINAMDTPDFLSHEKKYNRGQEEFVIIKDHHEPIISRELFDEANRILDAKSLSQEGKAKHSNRYPFSGKIKCGCCGSSYVARYKTRKDGSRYKAWRCNEAAKHGSPHIDKAGNQVGCTGLSIRNEDATHIMYLVTKSLKYNRNKIINNLTAVIQSIIAMDTTGTDVIKLQEQIKKIEGKRANLIDLYMSNLINKDEFTATRASCDAEIEELQSIIESVDKQREMIEQQQQLLKEIEDAIKEIVSGVEYEDEFYKHILDKMVVQDKDNIDVYLNLLPMKWSYTVAKASKKAVASEWNISEASLPMSVSRAFSSG